MLNYGKALKECRIINGKSLLDVERDTGINNANISRWEQGKVLPNIDFCVKLADYYGISLDELVGRDYVTSTPAPKK
ncbi:MAG: helix-turn-helix transcriptional regulator [Clostridia bacterium]|nr:helix-turn-helix transcriptional regulator [Clostridia bacterium]